MLIILDTSVIISFLLSRKSTHTKAIFKLLHTHRFQSAISLETLKELKNTLSHSKIKANTRFNNRRAAEFINIYQHTSKIFNLNLITNKPFIRDQSDNIFTNLALVSQAHYIITHDEDLLILKNIETTLIIKPEEFFILNPDLNVRH